MIPKTDLILTKIDTSVNGFVSCLLEALFNQSQLANMTLSKGLRVRAFPDKLNEAITSFFFF